MSTKITSIQPVIDVSPVAIIRDAVASNVDPQTLRELLAVRREWEADEARKAYSHAIADFQRRCPIIEKGDKAHNKQYAALDRIWRTIRGLLDETGLSIVWTVNAITDHGLHIEGEIRHRSGHSVPVSYDLPLPDKVTGQNAAQQMGSATTYAKRYALCAALGIVTGEDDDGHTAGTVTIDPAQVAEIKQALAGLDDFDRDDTLKALLEWAAVERVEDIPAPKFKRAMAAINARKK